jgi:hypothetical protein
MSELDHGGPDEDEPERGSPDEAADLPDREGGTPTPPNQVWPIRRPLIDLTSFLPALSTQFLPQLDLTQFLPQPHFSAMSHVDLSALRPAFDLTQFLPQPHFSAMSHVDLSALRPAFDLTQFLPKLDLSALLPGFWELLEDLRRHRPPNWPPGVDLERIVEVIRDDGLPLVWVPRAELVQEVVDAEDREARVAVLLAHAPELAQDCRGVLNGVTHAAFTGQQQLAGRCVEALEQEHHEAAQALAVAVTETAVSRTLGGNYAKVKQQVLFDPDLVPYTELRLRAALAPIHRFYTDWSPKSPHPAPEAVSRHVTVHHADPSHYTEANSLVAVLLACSVLRALQELQQLAEASGSGQETS